MSAAPEGPPTTTARAPLLLHGAAGIGLWDALRQRAADALCERPGAAGAACGRCAACRLRDAGTHPDRFALLPEALAIEVGEAAPAERGASPPSRDIAIDSVRRLVDWSHATSHRGRARVALVYPLDAMAAPAANALLKTLEEPPPGLYFYMGTHRLDRVLPTLRSRAVLQAMPRPTAAAALAVLQQRDCADAEAVAAWCRNAVHAAQPEAGLDWALGMLALLDGQGARQALVAATPPAAVAVTALQKISVDLMRARHALAPLYLPRQAERLRRLGAAAEPLEWLRRWQELARAAAQTHVALHAGLSAERWVLEFGHIQPRSEI